MIGHLARIEKMTTNNLINIPNGQFCETRHGDLAILAKCHNFNSLRLFCNVYECKLSLGYILIKGVNTLAAKKCKECIK